MSGQNGFKMDSWEHLEEEIIACRLCPRLVEWRETIARTRRKAFRSEEYWGKAVPGFGDPQAKLLVVGLAPGAHGSNRTGRMFTGDASGDFLYRALHLTGFANRPVSSSREDGLLLKDVFITAVNRCVPPDNKPTSEEMRTCRPYLLREMAMLKQVKGIVALGRIAFDNILPIIGVDQSGDQKHTFGHGSFYEIGAGKPWLLCSYHPSRQNTQTGRLTVEMFDQIWCTARKLLDNQVTENL